MYIVKSFPKSWSTLCERSRRQEVVLTRHRICHIMTKIYRMVKDKPPLCPFFRRHPLSVHIFIECTTITVLRRKFYLSDFYLLYILGESPHFS